MCKVLFAAILIALATMCASPARAQERDSATVLSVAAASLIPASLLTGIIVLNQEAFWRYATEVPFHISNDPPYAMHIDKFSHLYISAAGSDGMREAYKLAGLSDGTAAWLASALSFAGGVAIELEDARHGDDPQYGFSPGDAAGDLIGVSLPVLRHYYPIFNRLDTKISIWPSEAYKSGAYKTIADDYESQYYWLSFDLHEVTPMPAWMNVAVGFGCENLMRVAYSLPAPGGPPYTDVYFAPDINLKGIPIEGVFWRSIAAVLSYVRIPFPALQVWPRVKVWGLR